MSAGQPRRYVGDGLDYRRPMNHSRSSSQADVIDLTADDAAPSAASNNGPMLVRAQRPPRFAREIIDIDEEDSLLEAAPSDSPEIQFISARRLDPPLRQDPPTRHPHIAEDDVQFVGETRLPEARRVRNLGMYLFENPVRPHHPAHPFVQDIRARMLEQLQNRQHSPVPPPRGGQRRPHAQIHVGWVAPALDFGSVGFDLGIGGGPVPPPPTYDAPEAAPEGFTRSVAENDALICPHCGDELCTGDSEQKRQVWIVKICGHVYCGECTANRGGKRSTKGKEKQPPPRTKPFKECVVKGCQKRINTRSAMVQIFL
ncbi:hypothetical protein BDV95DRAFT_349505 [Massariosphaeria phaeospora]|uniref:Uncharacterized protein n=1 Tax=Massariosphaeria phaeospora TaxID=100035 RepID=A0A7C8MBG7_9PLEO|nr:hypothetical protein BDV95DRAFT_349505 [Massariosphaeria phaeospora]